MKTEVKNKLFGIEKILEKLRKSEQDEILDEEKEEEETEEGLFEDIAEETKEEAVEKAVEEDTGEEDETIEKSDESTEEEGEPVVEAEDGLEVDYDELVRMVVAEVKDGFENQIQELENSIDSMVQTMEKLAETTYEQRNDDSMEKSLQRIYEKLDEMNVRKSVDNINVLEKYKDKPQQKLSKSQKAEILAKALEAGNQKVRIQDITNMELGKPISKEAEEIINRSVR